MNAKFSTVETNTDIWQTTQKTEAIEKLSTISKLKHNLFYIGDKSKLQSNSSNRKQLGKVQRLL